MKKITMEELRRGIAASDREIDIALEAVSAVEIEGTSLETMLIFQVMSTKCLLDMPPISLTLLLRPQQQIRYLWIILPFTR